MQLTDKLSQLSQHQPPRQLNPNLKVHSHILNNTASIWNDPKAE